VVWGEKVRVGDEKPREKKKEATKGVGGTALLAKTREGKKG